MNIVDTEKLLKKLQDYEQVLVSIGEVDISALDNIRPALPDHELRQMARDVLKKWSITPDTIT